MSQVESREHCVIKRIDWSLDILPLIREYVRNQGHTINHICRTVDLCDSSGAVIKPDHFKIEVEDHTNPAKEELEMKTSDAEAVVARAMDIDLSKFTLRVSDYATTSKSLK